MLESNEEESVSVCVFGMVGSKRNKKCVLCLVFHEIHIFLLILALRIRWRLKFSAFVFPRCCQVALKPFRCGFSKRCVIVIMCNSGTKSRAINGKKSNHTSRRCGDVCVPSDRSSLVMQHVE